MADEFLTDEELSAFDFPDVADSLEPSEFSDSEFGFEDATEEAQFNTNLTINGLLDLNEEAVPEFPKYSGGTKDSYKFDTEVWAEQSKRNLRETSPEIYDENKEAIDSFFDDQADNEFRNETNVKRNYFMDSAARLTKTLSFAAADTFEGFTIIGREAIRLTGNIGGLVSEEFGEKGDRAVARIDRDLAATRELIEDQLDLSIPTDVTKDDALISQVSEGLGQGVGQIAQAVVSTPALVVNLIGMVDSVAQDSYDEVMELTGGDKAKASEAYRKTFMGYGLASAAEAFFLKGMGKALREAGKTKMVGKLAEKTLGSSSSKSALKKVLGSKAATTAGKGALAEGIQEGGEQASQNAAISTSISDEDLSFVSETIDNLTDEETLKAAGLGAIVGGILGGAGGAVVADKIRRGNKKILSGEDISTESFDKEVELTGYTPKDLAQVDGYITQFKKDLETVQDPDTKKELETQISRMQNQRDNVIAKDLEKQGIEVESAVKQEAQQEIDNLLGQRDTLQSQRQELVNNDLGDQKSLADIDTKIAELTKEADVIKSERLDTREGIAQTNLGKVEAKQEGDVDQAVELGKKLELDRAKGQVQSVESARSVSDVQSEIRTLKTKQKEVLKGRKLNAKQIEGTTKKASELASKLQTASDKKNAFDVVAAGDSRIVASRNVDSDAVDFAGNILAGFGISKPVALISNKDAGDKGIQALLDQEGTPAGKRRKTREGETLPSFSELQNSYSVKLNDGKLTRRNTEVIAHEVGHVVMQDLKSRDPKLQPALDTAYQEFIQSPGDIDTKAGEQVLPQRKAEAGIVNNPKALSQPEWEADNVGRYVQNRALKAKGPVERFFKNIATALRDIYTNLSKTGNPELKINKTIEQFLDEHFKEDRATAFLKNRESSRPPSPPTTSGANSNQANSDRPATTSVQSEPTTASRPAAATTVEPTTGGTDSNQSSSRQSANVKQVLPQKVSQSDLADIGVEPSTSELANQLLSTIPVDNNAKQATKKLRDRILSSAKGELAINKDTRDSIAKYTKATRAVVSRDFTLKQAKAVFDKFGVDEAINLVLDASSNLPGRVKVGLAALISSSMGKTIRELKAEGDTDSANQVVEAHTRFLDQIADVTAGESGRTVDMFKMLLDIDTPAGVSMMVNKLNKKIMAKAGKPDAELSPESKKDIETLAEELLSVEKKTPSVRKKFATDVNRVLLQDSGIGKVRLAVSAYKAGLLGLGTAAVNVVSTFSNMVPDMMSLLTHKGGRASLLTSDVVANLKDAATAGIREATSPFNNKEVNKYDTDFDFDDLVNVHTKEMKDLYNKRRDKGLSASETAKLATLTLAQIPVQATRAMFAGLSFTDGFFRGSLKDLVQRTLILNEVLGNPEVKTQEDLREVVSRIKLKGKDFSFYRNEARQTLSDKEKQLSERKLNSLLNRRAYEAIESQFDEGMSNESELFSRLSTFTAEGSGLFGGGSNLLIKAESLSTDLIETGLINLKQGKSEIGADSTAAITSIASGITQVGIGGTALGLKLNFIPFNTILSNVANSLIEFSPAGFILLGQAKTSNPIGKVSKQVKNSELLTRRLATRAALGSAVMTYAVAKAFEDFDDEDGIQFHGFGPADANARKQFNEQGKQSMSVSYVDKSGKRIYVPFEDTILAYALGPAAVISDKLRYDTSFKDLTKAEKVAAWNEKGFAQQLAIYAWQTAPILADTAIFASGTKLFKTISEANRTSIRQALKPNTTAAQFAGSLLTGGFSKVARDLENMFGDGLKPEVKSSMMGAMLSKFPYAIGSELSDKVRPQLNLFGEPVRYNMEDRFLSDGTDDVAWKFLGEKGIVIAGYSNSYTKSINVPGIASASGRKKRILENRREVLGSIGLGYLTDDEMYRMQEIAGPEIKKIVIAASKTMANDEPSKVKSAIDTATRAVKKAAKLKVIEEFYGKDAF